MVNPESKNSAALALKTIVGKNKDSFEIKKLAQYRKIVFINAGRKPVALLSLLES